MVEIDGGLITGLSEGEYICDNLIYTIKTRTAGLNITWFLELKGTKNEKEVKHAVDQIIKSILQTEILYLLQLPAHLIKRFLCRIMIALKRFVKN